MLNVYSTILTWIITFSVCPLILAFSELITTPILKSEKRILEISIRVSVIRTIAFCLVVLINRITDFFVLMITNDFVKVIIYLIILSIISNKNLYSVAKRNSKIQEGFLWSVSNIVFTFIPLKTIIYMFSLVCLILSQLQSFNVCEFTDFWNEFFSYHEHAVLIVFAIDEIVDYISEDIMRIKSVKKYHGREF